MIIQLIVLILISTGYFNIFPKNDDVKGYNNNSPFKWRTYCEPFGNLDYFVNHNLHKVNLNYTELDNELNKSCLSPNYENVYGNSLLHTSMHLNRWDLVEYLIDRGVNITRMFHERHIMTYAIISGNISRVDWVLEKGFGINYIDDYVMTPLTIAMINNQLEIAKHILENGGDPNIVENIYKNGNPKNWGPYTVSYLKTPLLIAIEDGMWEMFRLLVDYGANINIVDYRGQNILHNLLRYCWHEANFRFFKEFVSKGVDINHIDNEGVSVLSKALRCCCSRNQYYFLELLFDNNVDINVKDKKGITTMMDSLVCNIDTIEKIFNSTEFDIDIKDNEGLSAIAHASVIHDPLPMKFLIDKGADVNQRLVYKDNMTIFSYNAMFSVQRQHLINLLNAGADINEPDKYGYTPLMYSAIFIGTHIEDTKFLLELGANVNSSSYDIGWTALMSAAFSKKPGLMEILIEYGADAHARTTGEINFDAYTIPSDFYPFIQYY